MAEQLYPEILDYSQHLHENSTNHPLTPGQIIYYAFIFFLDRFAALILENEHLAQCPGIILEIDRRVRLLNEHYFLALENPI
jgi:hypothetical protein